MTYIVLASVIGGISVGYFLLPESILNILPNILTVGLCVLLFFVGLDIGFEGTAWKNVKKAGFRIFLFPIAVIIGTLVGGVVGSIFLPIDLKDSLLVSSGFGWYSLAPIIISDYSTEISAISFMHNVFRELFAILLIPFVAKYIGYIETISMPGAAAMDVCLPVVEKSTNGNIAIYSFISGLALSILVPILVPLFIQL